MVRKRKHSSNIPHRGYRFHAHKRLRVRYDVNIKIKDLVRCIRKYTQTDEFRIIYQYKSTCTRDEMMVEFQGHRLRLIYSRSTKQIVTFLPLEDK